MVDPNAGDVFAMLEPPPGGLTRVRARLDEADRSVRVMRRALAVTAFACLTALMVWPAARATRLESSPGLVRLGGAERPGAPVVAADGAVAVLAVERTPAVVYYRVASLRSGDAAAN